ncbi:MAG: serine hydrolase domain-containing protein [Actinomycetes bacterium]
MIAVHGYVKNGFEAVRDAFAGNFKTDFEVGASVAVMHKGEMVVDIWAGHTDLERTQPWNEDTLINVWSTTKTQMFLCVLILANDGLLSLDDPVAKFWPEFAAHGKDGVLVRHLMSHTSGLSGWDESIKVEDLYDHEKCAGLLAAQAPWWEPGTKSGYHAMTQGYLLGELVKRVTGISLGNFFRTRVAEPLNADFHIGTPASVDERVAKVIPAEQVLPANIKPESIFARTMLNPVMDARFSWTPEWRRCESPAANGHGNARSVALTQSIISHGGALNGQRFISPEMIERIFEVQADGVDLVLGSPSKIGIGYGLTSKHTPVSSNPRSCFWGGWGGSLCVNDLDAQMTFAYVMNRMGNGTVGDMRAAGPLIATHMAIAAL